MSETTVVHVNDPGGFDVYIGRANRFKRLPQSKWHNPYKVGQNGSRAEVIAMFRAYLLDSPALLADLHELRGKRLGCWCAPNDCHGRVLAEMALAAPPSPEREVKR